MLTKYCLIFLIGATGYPLLELLWRRRTHPSMALLGGICFVLIFYIHIRFAGRPLIFRALLCTAAITGAELVSGILLNRILALGVWDYSHQPLHLMGQICPLYSMLWFFLSLFLLFVLQKAKIL